MLAEQDSFLAHLRQLFDQTSMTDSLAQIRAKAWKRFLQIGLPTRNTEVYRSIRLRYLLANPYVRPQPTHLTKVDIESHLLPECTHSVLVFVNGVLTPELSDTSGLKPQVVVTSLSDATQSYGAFLNNQWALTLKTETDPFALINAALHLDGVLIYLPPQCSMGPPLQILHLIHGNQLWALPRIQVFMGKESRATLAVSTIGLQGTRNVTSQVCDVALEDNAQLHYLHTIQGLADDAWHFDALRARLKRNSVLKAVGFTDGARTVRMDSRVTLTGEGGDASLSGLWMISEKREAHANVLIEHQAPHCRSHQLFKGVLTDVSRSSFEGKILVQREAQKTEAYQLNHNLLLSDNANADSKPNLEIFADDVKASHGATVGQLDSETLFYLKARGLADEQARNLLIASFAKEVVDQIPVPSLHQQVTKQVEMFFV